MNQYSFKISFQVAHPCIDPNRITEALGREPKRAWRAGAPRTTSRGDPLTGTYDETRWSSGSFREGEWDGFPGSPQRLDEAIDAALRDLAEHKRLFQEIRSGGGSVHLIVGWFLNSDAREFFDHDLLRRMADLGLDLSLSVYPPHQDAAEPAPPQS